MRGHRRAQTGLLVTAFSQHFVLQAAGQGGYARLAAVFGEEGFAFGLVVVHGVGVLGVVIVIGVAYLLLQLLHGGLHFFLSEATWETLEAFFQRAG